MRVKERGEKEGSPRSLQLPGQGETVSQQVETGRKTPGEEASEAYPQHGNYFS